MHGWPASVFRFPEFGYVSSISPEQKWLHADVQALGGRQLGQIVPRNIRGTIRSVLRIKDTASRQDGFGFQTNASCIEHQRFPSYVDVGTVLFNARINAIDPGCGVDLPRLPGSLFEQT